MSCFDRTRIYSTDLCSRYDLDPAQPAVPTEQTTETTTTTPATTATTPAATLAVPSPTATRDRTSFRSRLREIRQAHTGTEYTSALRRLYHDHEHPRRSSSIHTADVAPQESRPT